MGKKKNDGFSVQKKDVFQRLNFLYQAAHWAMSMEMPNASLAKHYITTMLSLARKNVVRLSPHIKRTICKMCNMLLVPGVSCRVRHRKGKDKQKRMVTTCLECSTTKKLILNRNYTLWHDDPDNIVQIITLEIEKESGGFDTATT